MSWNPTPRGALLTCGDAADQSVIFHSVLSGCHSVVALARDPGSDFEAGIFD
jgi:hypothetical protein